ncbi:MAG: hypothetical protein WCG47_06945 [Dermatophilaceae bacterium]
MTETATVHRVQGQRDAAGDLVGLEIEGSAPGYDLVTVEVRCMAAPLSQTVDVVDGRFKLLLGGEEVLSIECFCGREIEVRVLDDHGEVIAQTWRGDLDCQPAKDGEGPGRPAAHRCRVDQKVLLSCDPPTASASPQHVLYFRHVLPFEELPLADQIDVEKPNPRLGNLVVNTGVDPLAPELGPALRLHLAALMRFEQRWFFRDFRVSDLVATITLAPHETLRLSIRQTQRKRLTQTTMDSVEELDSRESTLIDRDALNVARSMSKTEGWHVDGTGSYSVGGLGLGVSAGYSESVNRATQSTMQRLRESTTKSASTLKTLRKTEITEVSEVTEERLASRTLVNPYFDRTLLVRVFDQVKAYCLEAELLDVMPALVVAIARLPFDDKFVLRYGDFLTAHLLDTALGLELGEALAAANELRDTTDVQRAVEIAKLALHYLFDWPPNMFNVPFLPGPGPAMDPNDPASSFDAQQPVNALYNAEENHLGVIFTTLSYYYQIYIDRIAPQATPPGDTLLDDRFAVEIAVSLERFLNPLWLGVEDPEIISNVVDTNDRTEVFRRLSGFLALVSGVLTPLVAPVEKQREDELRIRRAEQVITRTADHLRDNDRYYTQAFLEYLQRTARQDLLGRFAQEAVGATALNTPSELMAQLNWDAVYLDRTWLIVPAQFDKSRSDFRPFSEILSAAGDEPIHAGVYVSEVEVPCEGSYFEASGGQCVLKAVPSRSTVVFEASGLTGLSVQGGTIETSN